MELGSRYSPEFVCTPFKLTLGTFIEGLERGATELAIGGCNSYCRFGYYWPVQKLILEDLGYKFKFSILNWDDPKGILKDIKNTFTDGLNYYQVFRAFRIAWRKTRLTDLVDKLLYYYRALEITSGKSDAVANTAYRMIVDAHGMKAIRRLEKVFPLMFQRQVEIKKGVTPLKIAVIGEIYVVLEPTLNVDVFSRLNKLGVITETPVSMGRFIDIGRKLHPFKKQHYKIADKAAKPYLAYRLGGEAQESIGDTILYKQKGWDGMIHLYPFTCMPEIVARSILPQVSREHGMPVLSFVVDEQTGEAGFQTRLEAFVDLIARKKEMSETKQKSFSNIEVVM
jgi:predicted nucleotide-binding protein (sugar kinase/HSP70/actin superfamily)